MTTRAEVRTFREPRTLKGNFDAHCHVCWNADYTGWIDERDPCGRCPLGHTRADQCPDAMGRARDAAGLAKLRQQGVVK